MATVHIDRLLDACITMGGSDLHLTVGRPPILRMHGRLRALETKVLTPSDTVALMKSITPEKNQEELQEHMQSSILFRLVSTSLFISNLLDWC